MQLDSRKQGASDKALEAQPCFSCFRYLLLTQVWVFPPHEGWAKAQVPSDMRPSAVNPNTYTKSVSSHLSLQWPVCDANPCSERRFWEDFAVPFSPGVLPSTVLEAASFLSPGLLGTTLFYEQFKELFLQPSHASAKHDMGLA